MTSKRIDVRSFCTPGFRADSYKSGEKHFVKDTPYDYAYERYELSGERLHIEGQRANGDSLYERSIEGGGYFSRETISETDRKNMLIGSKITNEYCFSFGMFYSTSSWLDLVSKSLPEGHQLRAIITENYRGWMKSLFAKYQAHLDKIKLQNLILPGAHDAGMYNHDLIIPVSLLANTQIDNIGKQLQMGARIFDIRPGYTPFNDIRHLHGNELAKGDYYKNMLVQIADFLSQNTQEIVVIHLCDDGIPNKKVNIPPAHVLEEIAASAVNGRFSIGNKSSLSKSIRTLLDNHERLIIISKDYAIHEGDKIETLSSYTDGYESVNVGVIVNGLNRMNNKSKAEWDNADLVEISLQLTASAVTKSSTISKSLGTDALFDMSPLVATKAACDATSYPWIRDNEFKPDALDTLVGLYNDLYDGGQTAVTIKALEKRLDRVIARP